MQFITLPYHQQLLHVVDIFSGRTKMWQRCFKVKCFTIKRRKRKYTWKHLRYSLSAVHHSWYLIWLRHYFIWLKYFLINGSSLYIMHVYELKCCLWQTKKVKNTFNITLVHSSLKFAYDIKQNISLIFLIKKATVFFQMVVSISIHYKKVLLVWKGKHVKNCALKWIPCGQNRQNSLKECVFC